MKKSMLLVIVMFIATIIILGVCLKAHADIKEFEAKNANVEDKVVQNLYAQVDDLTETIDSYLSHMTNEELVIWYVIDEYGYDCNVEIIGEHYTEGNLYTEYNVLDADGNWIASHSTQDTYLRNMYGIHTN